MVCAVCSVRDFYQESSRIRDLEKMFIERRETAFRFLLEFEKLVAERSSSELESDLYMYGGLSIEASRFDDEYRALAHKNFSNPNYSALMVLYRGVKNKLIREIRHKQAQGA